MKKVYPLKTSENLTVCLCFQWVEKGCIGNKRVNQYCFSFIFSSLRLRSNRSQMFFKIVALKNFTISQEKTGVGVSF